ncbi:sigma-70 family RNA polymerase sigma factor [bacterium]|nr:sigma-70 family RNA polymerase sigma factor [bacterium]
MLVATNKLREAKFKELIAPHNKLLQGMALKMTKNPEDAGDLIQDTFFKAYRFFDSFEEGTNFRAWIFKIMTNSYITFYRKKAKQPKMLSYDVLEDFFLYDNLDYNHYSTRKVNADLVYEKIYDDDIKKALDTLPEQFRSVILLCDIEGLSYKEIEEIQGIPLGTVMSRIFRGRKILQKSLLKYAKEKGFIKNSQN